MEGFRQILYSRELIVSLYFVKVVQSPISAELLPVLAVNPLVSTFILQVPMISAIKCDARPPVLTTDWTGS